MPIKAFALAVLLFTQSGAVSECAAKRGSPSPEGIRPKPAAVRISVPRLSGSRRHPVGKQIYFINFFRNVDDNPDVAARALFRALEGVPQRKVRKFIERNYHRIARMIGALQNRVAGDEMTQKEYDALVLPLGKFGIRVAFVSLGDSSSEESPAGAQDSSRPAPAQDAPGQSDDTSNPIMRMMAVRQELDNGNHEAAAALTESLQRDYPDSPAVQVAAAEYYNEMHSYSSAEMAATNAIQADPENTDALKARSMARFALKDRRGAMEDIQRAMEIDPEDETSRVLAALMETSREIPTLKSLSSLKELKKAFEHSGISSPQVLEKKLLAGKILFQAGGEQRSGVLGVVSSHDYGKSRGYTQSAAAKISLGDYGGAIKDATLAIQKNPNNMEAYLERAVAHNFLKRYDDSIRDSTIVINRDRDNPMALNIRSWALNQKGRFSQASMDASRAIDSNPKMADAWFNRSHASEKLGQYRQMLEDLQQAALLDRSYESRFRDALNTYSSKAPDFKVSGALFPRDGQGSDSASGPGSGGNKRFLFMLIFTLVGGFLVAAGGIHVFSGRWPVKMAESFAGITGMGVAAKPRNLTPPAVPEGVLSGKYKITRQVGIGGMGIIYEAQDRYLGRKVAVKKMRDEIKVNEREKERFLSEARTVASLQHPNIVEIHTVFEEEDDIYLVFEYVDGITLDRKLDTEFRLSLRDVKPIFDGICKALDYAHSKNIIHRDLKLSNIMVSEDGQAKVMDFGIARQARETMARHTHVEIVGSPAYMSPEQDTGAMRKESDIFAMGVCLYEALTGELPFKGPRFDYQKSHRIYAPASSLVPELPEEIDRLLARAMEPDPEKRIHSAEEFRKTLEETLLA